MLEQLEIILTFDCCEIAAWGRVSQRNDKKMPSRQTMQIILQSHAKSHRCHAESRRCHAKFRECIQILGTFTEMYLKFGYIHKTCHAKVTQGHAEFPTCSTSKTFVTIQGLVKLKLSNIERMTRTESTAASPKNLKALS